MNEGREERKEVTDGLAWSGWLEGGKGRKSLERGEGKERGRRRKERRLVVEERKRKKEVLKGGIGLEGWREEKWEGKV